MIKVDFFYEIKEKFYLKTLSLRHFMFIIIIVIKFNISGIYINMKKGIPEVCHFVMLTHFIIRRENNRKQQVDVSRL
jgi:hypothetical protein